MIDSVELFLGFDIVYSKQMLGLCIYKDGEYRCFHCQASIKEIQYKPFPTPPRKFHSISADDARLMANTILEILDGN